MNPAEDVQTVNSLTPEDVETDTPVNELTSKYGKLSLHDIELLLRLKAEGLTQVEIATALKCSQSTVSATLSRLKATPALVQALAQSEAVPMLERWITASKAAAKRGDHRPAREFIELAAPELRPQQGSGAGGVGVTIVIGQPGQPVSLPDITVSPVLRTGSALSPAPQIAVSDAQAKAKATPNGGVSPPSVA